MAPACDPPEEADGTSEQTGKTKKNFSNPTVLKAALDIVKHKKEEAVQAEQYDQAARFHQKIQQLEAQLAVLGKEADDDEASDTGGGEDEQMPRRQRRSLLSAPNPFRTVELLERSGYNRPQACAMLFLLYFMVFVLEMILLYVGWRVLGLGGETSEEGFSDDMMEEL
mmetsp:Transcript_750/g.1009  ORF Transcript_750/g.1009 Transcript_750/m.1009 type:complete len:168 (-) Transcript_750:54-557(-)